MQRKENEVKTGGRTNNHRYMYRQSGTDNSSITSSIPYLNTRTGYNNKYFSQQFKTTSKYSYPVFKANIQYFSHRQP